MRTNEMDAEANSADVLRLGNIEISNEDMKWLSTGALVERLVDRGASRLTAMRFVEIHRGAAEPGRARSHPVSRR